MICYQGEEVWPYGKGAPSLYSIGVALGRIPRFCGHTRDFYPVLGHVLTVAAILPPEYALYGLLHDAPEACVSDVPTPWKTVAARKREHKLLKRIYKSQGLEWPLTQAAQQAVDDADRTCLVAEAHAVGHPAAERIWGPVEEADQDAYQLSLYHLENAAKYLIPEISGPIYEQAYVHYHELVVEYKTPLTCEQITENILEQLKAIEVEA